MKCRDLFHENEKELKQIAAKFENTEFTNSESKMLDAYIEQSVIFDSETAKNMRVRFFSIIRKYRKKVCELIYAFRIKNYKKEYQLVSIRVEGNVDHLVRNVYYSNFGGYQIVWKDSHPAYYLWHKDDYNQWQLYDIKWFVTYKQCLSRSLGKEFKYCDLKLRKANFFDYAYFATVYRLFPEIEILTKLDICEYYFDNYKFLLMLQQSKGFKSFLIRNGKEIKEKIPKANILMDAYKKAKTVDKAIDDAHEHNIFLSYLNDAKYIIEHLPNELNKELWDKKKLAKYIQENSISIYSYNDFIKAANYVKCDFTQDKNKYPHDFSKWHEHYTKQYNLAKSKEIDESMNKVADKYEEMEGNVGGYIVKLARSTQELIDEGEKLEHCVGRMEYNKKMAQEESLILFVRQEENIPLYTLEWDIEKHKINQFYGKKDSRVPDEVKEIFNKWQSRIKRLKIA